MSEEKKTISATSLVAAIDAGLSVPTASEWIEARPDLHFSSDLVAQLCDRYVKSDRAFYQAEIWLRQLADHEANPELSPMPFIPPMARAELEQAFPVVDILRESFEYMAKTEGDRILFYAYTSVPDRPEAFGGPRELRAQDMIDLLDQGDPLIREYLETLTASTIRSVLLRREVKNSDPKELTFKKVGSDIGGRDVLEVDGHTDLYGAAGAIAAYCKKLQVTRALLWNGIATLCFPGMTREEWIVENEIRRTAYQSGKWPQQLMPFSPEIDPFKITPVS